MWRPFLDLIQTAHTGNGDPAHGWRAEWSLQRRPVRAMQPVLVACVGFTLLSLMLAAVLWRAGINVLLAFAALELSAAVAVLFQTRHASDRDFIAMKPSLVRVEQHRAGRVRRLDFHPRWLRVEPDRQDGSLIRLSALGRSIVVGEYVPREGRPQLAKEFRWALRHLHG